MLFQLEITKRHFDMVEGDNIFEGVKTNLGYVYDCMKIAKKYLRLKLHFSCAHSSVNISCGLLTN